MLKKIKAALKAIAPRQWVQGTVAVLIALGLALASYSNALGNYYYENVPAATVGQVGFGDYPLGRVADLVVAVDPSQPQMSQAQLDAFRHVDGTARASLRAQAVNTGALYLLGRVAAANNDTSRANQFMTFSEALSRRESRTQSWLAASDLQRGDVSGTMHHIDVALRTTPQLESSLFPGLLAITNDPRFQPLLGKLINPPAPWLASFLNYSLSQNGDSSGLANVIIRAGGLPDGADYRTIDREMLTNLAINKQFDALRSYYDSLKGAVPNSVSGLAMNEATTNPQFTPISWDILNNAVVGAGFEKAAGDALRLHVALSGNATQTVAHKLLYLVPGNYALTGVALWNDTTGSGNADWVIHCASTGAEIEVAVADDKDELEGNFTVPNGCAAVDIGIQLSSGAEAGDRDVTIEKLRIARVGA